MTPYNERYKFTDIQAIQAAGTALPEVAPTALWNGQPLITPNQITTLTETDNTLTISTESRSALTLTIQTQPNTQSRLTIHYTHCRFIESTLNIEIGEGAQLELWEIAETQGTLISTLNYHTHKDSTLNIKTLDIDNRTLIRNQDFALKEQGVEVNVEGIYLCGNGETADNYLKMNHLVDNGRSSQLYKGIVAQQAAFTGHIYIAQGAGQTIALQENHNIILNDNARINTRPWLEIYADDVKCNHGATIGKSDPEAVYYMRQRGIPEAMAQKLLLEGFITHIINPAHPMAVRMTAQINAKLATL